ncbi:MAG: hypothetical protein H6672_12510 [Anaerolineaceae bacterium]|nr:hypothetical protein [Anaerolineaceae bacterium]
MQTGGDLLWRVNNEYRKRLAQAQTYLDLLEQMMLADHSNQYLHTLNALHYIREQIEEIVNEHRHWRQQYYYESPETKRMVQQDRAVMQALSRFNRMRAHQEAVLRDMLMILGEASRPHPDITRVPSGDLWEMAEFALYDLIEFDNFLTENSPTG